MLFDAEGYLRGIWPWTVHAQGKADLCLVSVTIYGAGCGLANMSVDERGSAPCFDNLKGTPRSRPQHSLSSSSLGCSNAKQEQLLD